MIKKKVYVKEGNVHIRLSTDVVSKSGGDITVIENYSFSYRMPIELIEETIIVCDKFNDLVIRMINEF